MISYDDIMCTFIFFFICLLMLRRPPRSTRTDTLFPYTTLFRSADRLGCGWTANSYRLNCGLPLPLKPFCCGWTANSYRLNSARWTRRRFRSCGRSEEHTSELQSLMRISYAVFCLKKKKNNNRKEYNYLIQTSCKSSHTYIH